MINKLAILALPLFLLASCNKTKEDNLITHEEKNNPYFTGIDLSNTAHINWQTKDYTDEYYMLGYGYDITGKYAHPASTRNKVIDLEAFDKDDGTIFQSFSSSGGPELGISGTREACLKTMGQRAGLSSEELARYKHIFKETFESAFKNDTTFKSLDYQYEGISQVVIFATFGIYDLDFSEFQSKYLTAQFKKDLETKSAKEIIALYGTHVLKRINIGQRMDYLYRHNQEYNGRRWLTPTIRKHFAPGPSLWTETPPEAAPLKQNLAVELVGGNRLASNFWMIDVTNYTGEKIVSQEWSNLSETNHTLVDFDRNDGVIPIYKFVKDETKKKALIVAYNAYLGL